MIALAIAAFLCGQAPAGAASDQDRFVALHRCDVLARLRRIHERGPRTTSRDRFLSIGVRDRPDHYVQCMFGSDDTRMLCEASSGAYGGRPDLLAPAAVATLRGLGFALPDPAGNFRQEVALGEPPDLEPVTELMLTVLSAVYGADLRSTLDFEAPKAPDAGAACRPVSSRPSPDRRVT